MGRVGTREKNRKQEILLVKMGIKKKKTQVLTINIFPLN